MNLENALINMYRKFGSMVEVRCLFDSLRNPNIVQWNTLIFGYAENGEVLVALQLFSSMKASGYVPDSFTYVAALKACTSLVLNGDSRGKVLGIEIHSEIGSHLSTHLQNTLVDMYAKLGMMTVARTVFDSIEDRSVVSWNVLILGYADHGEGHIALDLFRMMKAAGFAPDSSTYIAAIKACSSLAMNKNATEKAACLELGREIHLEAGLHLSHRVQATLIDMYCKYGSMVDARCVFNSIQKPDVVSWNVILLGYVENGQGLEVLDLLSTMKASGCVPDAMTYISALKGCGLIGALSLGRRFHSEIWEFSPQVVTCLVDFYAKCGSLEEARKVFEAHSSTRDVTTWTALLAGYGRFGDSNTVFNLFKAMQDQGLRPDAITFVCLLLSCSHAGLVEKAREYFDAMMRQYGVTPTVVHYACMVDVLGRRNKLQEAIEVIQQMPFSPPVSMWITLLGACRKWKNVEMARQAFQAFVNAGEHHGSAYVLMANMFGENMKEPVFTENG